MAHPRRPRVPTPWLGGALVGRDELVGELAVAARNAVDGRGSLFLLEADAGMGKTSVARSLADAVRDDIAVSWSACTVDRSAPPFWLWRDVIDVDPATTGDDELLPDPAIGAERYSRLSQLRQRLFAQAGPRLLVFEDLQWADVSSILLLHHVQGALLSAPLMIVATLRTDDPLTPQLRAAVAEARRVATVRDVPPLTREEIAQLVRSLAIAASSELVALIHERTGGNPLFVTELLRAVRATDPDERISDIVTGAVPDRISELIAHRLGRLPDAVAELVTTASVIGAEGDVRTLAAVRGSSVEAVVDLIEQGRAARLLETAAPGRWRFGHELVRDAVYASASDTVRARTHARVLEALAANPVAPAPVLAHHALAAQPLFDAERAVALAAAAGASAFSQHGYEEAVVWFERALAAAPADIAPRWRAELLVACGEAHRHIGDVSAAGDSFLQGAEHAEDAAVLARAALGYADPGADLGIAYRTEDPRVADLLERAIAAQPPGDSLTTVLLESRLAAELYFSDHPGRARELAHAACARARRLGDPRALGVASAVAHDAFVVGQADLGEQLQGSQQLLDWAREDGSAAALLTAHRARVFDLLAAGDMVAMDAEILAFRRIAEPLRAPAYLWWLSLWSAMRTALEGRLDAAEAEAFAAYEIGERPLSLLAFTNLSFTLFFLRREQGRFGEMEAATREFAATQADVPAIRVALMFLLAETGHIDEARGMLRAVDDAELSRLRDRNWPASWFQLARTAALVGDVDVAKVLLDDAVRPTERCVMVSLGTVCLGSSDLATAWLLHAAGDFDAASDHYATAADVNARIGARSWLAQARADHARLLLDRDRPGDRDRARDLTELAATEASEGLRSLDPLLAELRARLEGGPQAPADSRTGTARSRTFRRAGGIWEIAFNDLVVQVPHARGLNDIAYLLARPDEPVYVMELAAEGSVQPASRGPEAFDEQARREIRTKLHDLEATIADAEATGDGERAALAREARGQLAETVARDLGLGGRSRRIDDPVERARKTVSTRIRRTIASLGEVHPDLGRHLERSIDTGAWCAYRPAEPGRWNT